MGDLSKEPLHLLPGEGFGQGAPAPDKMTGLHGIASHELLLEAKVKKMLQRIEPAVDGRPRTAVLMLGLHKIVHLAKRHLGEGDGHHRKKHVEIERITGPYTNIRVTRGKVAEPLLEPYGLGFAK